MVGQMFRNRGVNRATKPANTETGKMITDNDLVNAIAGIVAEFHDGDIGLSIAARDIRKAVALFNEQPTEECTEERA